MRCLFKCMNNLKTCFLRYSYSVLRISCIKKTCIMQVFFSKNIYWLKWLDSNQRLHCIKNNTTVTPTTAPQTKTNPPKGGCVYGGRCETRTHETPKKVLAVFETAAIAAMRTFQNNCDSGPLLLSTLRSHI